MRHGVLVYFFIIFVVASLIGGSVFTTYSQFVAEGPLSERKEIVIPRGKSLKRISNILYKKGVISSPSVFVLGVRASGKMNIIKAGEYSFPPHASAKMVMNIITSGQTYIRRLCVPEGLSSSQIVALMNSSKGLVGIVSKIPKNGTLLPDTYHYSYGDTKEGMILRMQKAMERTLKKLWEERDTDVPFKTAQEAVIMASIVEKETGLSKERPMIASVFINRLNKGMKLQSDPTVIYALTEGNYDLKRSLTYRDLHWEHPYNTYVVTGLPLGAISNPGKDAIKAVLHPAQSKNLYFVADGNGGHVFAENYVSHQSNVQKWRTFQKKMEAKATSMDNLKE